MTLAEIRLTIEVRLHQLLATLPPELPPDLRIEITRGDKVILFCVCHGLSAIESTVEKHELSECERDVLGIVSKETARLGRRILNREVSEALKRRGIHWGWSTVVASLSNLTSLGLLKNPRDRKGYGLPSEESNE